MRVNDARGSLPWEQVPRGMEGYAWVTLATTDSYSLGALVLAHSLKQVGTKHQLAVLITPGVTNPMRNKLKEVFDLVEEVNILDSKDETNLKLLKRPELGITFTKLHCWRLTQYEKCVFLDADTLVLENCDELFERDELSAAPDVGWPDCFNSGVFVYCPSNQTFSNLIQFALDKGSFDGGDQGLLNLYFSDWAHKDIRKHLPFIYNMSSTACYSYLPAFKQFGSNAKIVHFIGGTKPWLQYFDIQTRTVHPSFELQHMKEVLQYWWNIFCNSVHPNLSNEMSNTSTSTGYGNFPQNITHTSYYYQHESQNTYVADDYKNVWDPWEEYLEKMSHDQPSHNETQTSHYHSSGHNHQDQYQSNEDQFHSDDHYHLNEVENHPYQESTHHQEQANISLFESHNTNTEFAHHTNDHEKYSSSPTYSQSQPSYPTVHYDPPSCPNQEPPMTEPPPPLPSNESNECVATMVVSNETSLHNSHEDKQTDDVSIL
ncbi:unnamed protein product [Acanthoscelides obtectus]|uniref:glycogenin glucosyltransferase n=3 Tax=Acanthoscelides obtectus TaxID=200917 RepID=A0A9P0KNL8_ACAOB|nr:unnamed protein product [Acanthoscelides obtectus]CAK1628261.1 Glycogenin-1 [Acanthoscelides obtectus]